MTLSKETSLESIATRLHTKVPLKASKLSNTTLLLKNLRVKKQTAVQELHISSWSVWWSKKPSIGTNNTEGSAAILFYGNQ